MQMFSTVKTIAWRGLRALRCTTAAVVALTICWPAVSAHAIGWDSDDFIVAAFNSDQIRVYDSDLTFKGTLDTNFDEVTGLDFDAAGRLVAAGQNQQVRVYDSAGAQLAPLSFSNPALGDPLDLKVGPSGNYYIATQSPLVEFSPAGVPLRTFSGQPSSTSILGVAILPGNVMWGGFQEGPIEVFDLISGNLTGTIPLDGGQLGSSSMTYSAATNTVLIADERSHSVYERRPDGSLVRTFSTDGINRPFGVTRGPGGDVFASDFDAGKVFRWNAAGVFQGVVDLGLVGPVNIVWTGNIPEPTSLVMLGIACAAIAIAPRRARTTVSTITAS